MTLAAISCCEKVPGDPDQGKFPHPCGCPSASINLRKRKSGTAIVRGSKPYEPESSLVRYKREDISFSSWSYILRTCCEANYQDDRSDVTSGTFTREYTLDGPNGVTFEQGGSYNYNYINRSCDPETCNVSVFEDSNSNIDLTTFNYLSSRNSNNYTIISPTSQTYNASNVPDPPDNRYFNVSETYTKSLPDTWQDAEERILNFLNNDATLEDSFFSQSSWPSIQSTSEGNNDWSIVRFFYSVNVSGLIPGLSYDIIAIKERRPWIIDDDFPNGDDTVPWQPVASSSFQFVASSESETIDNGGDLIEIDFVQGWQYRLLNVSIKLA